MTDRTDLAARLTVTLLSAALLSVLCAPYDLHFLHWAAYLPFFWVLREDRPRANLGYAFVYAVFAEMVIFRWVTDTIRLYSNIPGPLAVVLLGLFSVGYGLPYFFTWLAVHPLRRRLGDAWILAFPAWLVVVEYLSQFVILFPYHQGITQHAFQPTWQLASVTGVYGLSFLVMFVNTAFAEGIYRYREGRPFPAVWAGASVLVTLAVIGWGWARARQVEDLLAASPVLRLGQIQMSTTMNERFDAGARQTFLDWVALNKEIAPGSADLVVWSEGASPFNVHEGAPKDVISALAAAGNYEILVGGGTHGPRVKGPDGKVHRENHNSVYLFGRDGTIKGRYDKNIPLPFGEYLPLASVFPILKEWIQGPGDFRAGTEANVLVGEHRIAAPICYEAILPSACRRYPNPDLLVNVTQDAWFGDTAAPHLHAMLAEARAVELGVPLVRSAYAGTSMVVEPHGVVRHRTPVFTRVARVVDVRMGKVPTIYAQLGDWFVAVCALGLAGALLARAVAARTSAKPPIPAP